MRSRSAVADAVVMQMQNSLDEESGEVLLRLGDFGWERKRRSMRHEEDCDMLCWFGGGWYYVADLGGTSGEESGIGGHHVLEKGWKGVTRDAPLP